jgi:hypothetical protein
MPRQQIYCIARENREKYIIAELLIQNEGICHGVIHNGDHLSFIINSKSMEIDGDNTDNELTKVKNHHKQYFTFGNTTVLNWGKITTSPGFHNACHIFPVGFKCIRQEFDSELDKVVDCVCEVDYYNENDIMIPLYRLTVSWELEFGKMEIKVYEAKTPQQCWQSAMLENLGQSNNNTEIDNNIDKNNNEIELKDEDNTVESDDEEKLLRTDLRELRRNYFRAIRSEQSLGLTSAVKPRLSLDAVDSFCDEDIMKLIEGMDGADDCKSYRFNDTRDTFSSKNKQFFKGMNKMHQKVKSLEKILEKNKVVSHFGKSVNRNQPEKRATSFDYTKFEELKKLKVDNKESKAVIRAKQLQEDSERKNYIRIKIRDFDRKVKELKEDLLKAIKVRKDDAKIKIDKIVKLEEKEIKGIASHLSSSNIDIASNISSINNMVDDDKIFTRPEPITTSPLCLDGDIYSQILEIWDVLSTYSHIINLETLTSIQSLTNAIKMTDPSYKHLYNYYIKKDGNNNSPIDDANQLLNNIGIALCKLQKKEYLKYIGIENTSIGIDVAQVPINILTWKEIARVILIGSVSKELGLGDSDLAAHLRSNRGNPNPNEGTERKAIKIARRRIVFAYSIRNEIQEAVIGFNSGLCISIPAPKSNNKIINWTNILYKFSDVPSTSGWLIKEYIEAIISTCSNQFQNIKFYNAMQLNFEACLESNIFQIDNASESKEIGILLLKYIISRDNSNENDSSIEINLPTSLELLYSQSFVLKRSLIKTIDSSNVDIDDKEDKDDKDDNDIDEDEEGNDNEELDKQQIEIDNNALAVSLLTISMQRCYYLLNDLINHPLSEPFRKPIARSRFPSYYKVISQPLCLYEIRKFLLDGGYNNSMTNFFSDINLVFENAIAFNPEGSIPSLTAIKLNIIFERMFLEIVLSWDNVLPFFDSCHFCRSHDEPCVGNKGVKCERCDAMYHLSCLNPPLLSPPRSDWYCPGCIEQRGIAFVHPNNISKVRHPTIENLTGEVVGMEQIKQNIIFIIQFGNKKEMWTGKQVRNQMTQQLNNDTVMKASDDLLVNMDPSVIYKLPSGYTYEDFDEVCGLAKGYSGWGSSLSMIPCYISDNNSNYAAKKRINDPFFDRCRGAIAILGPLGESDNMNSNEWITVLRCLIQRLLVTQSIQLESNKCDREIDKNIEICNNEIQSIDANISSLIHLLGDNNDEYNDEYNDGDYDNNSIKCDVDKDSDDYDSEFDNNNSDDDVDSNGGDSDDSDAVEFFKEDKEDEETEDENDDGSETNENDISSDSIDADSDDYDSTFDSDDEDNNNKNNKDNNDTIGSLCQENSVKWEQLRVSRRRGREDVLMNFNLIIEILDGLSNIYDDSDKLGRARDPDVYNTVFMSSIKSSIIKPPDNIDIGHWLEAILIKVSTWGQALVNGNDNIIRCQYCNHEEHFLASPFVFAHSITEWNRDVVDTTTWQLFNEDDSSLESKYYQNQNLRSIQKGSIICHEFCAEYMNNSRKYLYNNIDRVESRKMAELFVGIGRAKTIPIGVDSLGDYYWIFTGSKAVHISSSIINEDNSNITSYIDTNDGKTNPNVWFYDTSSEQNKQSIWRIYDTMNEIGNLIVWLEKQSEKHYESKKLMKTLILLFPSALEAASHHVNTNVINNNLLFTNNKELENEMKIDDEDNRSKYILNNKNLNEIDKLLEVRNKDDGDNALDHDSDDDNEDNLFIQNQKIYIQNSDTNLIWNGTIHQVSHKLITNNKKTIKSYVYKIKFDNWNNSYDGWFNEDDIIESTSNSMISSNKDKYILDNVISIPDILTTLNAYSYINNDDREFSLNHPLLTYNDRSTIGILRSALFLIELALPCGGVDFHNDRWGNDFILPWRESVLAASEPTNLMQCVVMLEMAVKSAWYRSFEQKVMHVLLSSKQHALRNATYGVIAMRLWCLDNAIRYDKVILKDSI